MRTVGLLPSAAVVLDFERIVAALVADVADVVVVVVVMELWLRIGLRTVTVVEVRMQHFLVLVEELGRSVVVVVILVLIAVVAVFAAVVGWGSTTCPAYCASQRPSLQQLR